LVISVQLNNYEIVNGLPVSSYLTNGQLFVQYYSYCPALRPSFKLQIKSFDQSKSNDYAQPVTLEATFESTIYC